MAIFFRLLLLAAACSPLVTQAQTFLSEIDPIVADTVGEKAVRSVHTDGEGRLWVGSQSGLDVFVGKRRWEPKGQADDHLKPPWNADIVSIDSDGLGNLFVLTANSGLFGFKVADEELHAKELLQIESASALSVRSEGRLWVAYGTSIIELSVNHKTLHLVESHNFQFDSEITTDFALDQSGQVCAGHARAIQCKKTHETWRTLAIRDDWLDSSTPLSLTRNQIGQLFIGFSSGRIAQVAEGNDLIQPIQTWNVCKTEPCRITALRAVGDGLLVGSDNGLYILNAGGDITLIKSQLHVTALDLQDDDIWVSTYAGLMAYGVSPFQTYNSDSHNISDEVLTFAEFPNGDVLVGTYDGAYRFSPDSADKNSFKRIHSSGDAPLSKVMASARLGQAIIVAERQSGLALLTAPDSSAQFVHKNRAFGAPLTVLSGDSESAAYAGTADGALLKLSRDEDFIKLEKLFPNADLFNSPVTSITPLDEKRILVTSERKALILCPDTGSTCGTTMLPPAATGKRILCSARFGDGSLLLGLQNGGIFRSGIPTAGKAPKYEFAQLSEPELENSSVYAVSITDKGAWLSTSTGLYEISIPTHRVRRFTKYDGLQGDDFNYGASLRHSSGDLYFGGSNGFNRFNPDLVEYKPAEVRSFISRVEVGPERHRLTTRSSKYSSVLLRSDDKYLNFQFFTNQYFENPAAGARYSLKGFDSSWIDSNSSNEATYTSLPPGEYQFHVQARNSDGSWEAGGAVVNVRVERSIWASTWAFILYALFFLLFAFVSRHYYASIVVSRRATQLAREMSATAEQAMEDMQEEVEMQARLLENVTSRNVATLSWIAELVGRQADTLPDVLSSEMAKVSLERIQAFVCLEHALRYRHDRVLADLRSFTDECSALLLSRRKGERAVTLINEASDTLVDAEHAARLATVLYELLANALDHAFDGRQHGNFLRVALEFSRTPGAESLNATITVEDNGVGLPEGIAVEDYDSAGFSLIREVSAYYGGRLEQKASGAGTTLRIELPLPADALA